MSLLNLDVFKEFPVLETERLLLRAFALDDTDDFYTLRNHPDVLQAMDRPADPDKEAVRTMIASIQQSFEEQNGISWVLELKENNAFIGTFGFWRMWPEHARAEVGYSLLPEFWRKGYMLEAMEACMQFAFQKMNIHSVMANINPDNAGSWKLLERLGFRQEAHFREDYYANGQFFDSYIYCCLERDLRLKGAN